jgi:cyclopropane fatty-acyl-phospholipid synthase-like methyltransferase
MGGVDQRKILVRDAYDLIAGRWGEKRRAGPVSRRERAWFERFLAALPRAGRVLDLGCGVGAPIAATLVARGHRTIGVDFSSSALAEARTHCPGAALVRADLTCVEFASASFDGAIAFDSIWHVPHHEHARIFTRLRAWLADGAPVLLTLAAASASEGNLFTHLMGAPIYYDAQPEIASLQALAASGFAVVDHHLQPVSAARPSNGHLIVLATAAV